MALVKYSTNTRTDFGLRKELQSFQELLNKKNVILSNEQFNRGLALAIQCREKKLVIALLQMNGSPSLDVFTEAAKTDLETFIKLREIWKGEMISVVDSNGCQVTWVNWSESTSLAAAEKGNWVLLRSLIEEGCPCNPLLCANFAVKNNDFFTLYCLLEKFNIPENPYQELCRLAARLNRSGILKQLRDYRAQSFSAFDLIPSAVEGSSLRVLRFLSTLAGEMFKADRTYNLVISKRKVDVLAWLLQEFPGYVHKDHLQMARRVGDKKIIELLEKQFAREKGFLEGFIQKVKGALGFETEDEEELSGFWIQDGI